MAKSDKESPVPPLRDPADFQKEQFDRRASGSCAARSIGFCCGQHEKVDYTVWGLPASHVPTEFGTGDGHRIEYHCCRHCGGMYWFAYKIQGADNA